MSKFPPVLILAGGLGTRLGPEHAALPKSLVDVNGTPFINHQLDLLKREGVSQVVLCLGHHGEALKNYVGDGQRFGLQVQISFDGDKNNGTEKKAENADKSSAPLLGTGGAVLKASYLLRAPFAVMYGDSWLDTAYAPVFESFKSLGKAALITVHKNQNQKIPSNMLVKDGQVLAYDKEQKTKGMQHVDYGLSIFEANAFANFKNGNAFDLGEVLQDLIGRGQLACHEVKEPFYEVGSVTGLAELKQHLKNSNLNSQGKSVSD